MMHPMPATHPRQRLGAFVPPPAKPSRKGGWTAYTSEEVDLMRRAAKCIYRTVTNVPRSEKAALAERMVLDHMRAGLEPAALEAEAQETGAHIFAAAGFFALPLLAIALFALR